jgi:murein DD-endopeptidase MepM/ murein hydrolase activator NlpD
MRLCKPRIAALIALVFSLFSGTALFAEDAAPPGWIVRTEPAAPVNGSPVLFQVTAPAALARLHGKWAEHDLDFRFSEKCKCWYAIGGIELNARPGKRVLTLDGEEKNKEGQKLTFDGTVVVSAKRYPSVTLTLAPAYVQPPPEVQARIEEEQALKQRLFSQGSPESYWLGQFEPPVETGVSAIFGSARVLNGVKKTQHQGLDFHAATGTTVRATNAGTVLLARSLYYEGNCVVVDHGQGLLTFYMHLSEFKVQEGDKVERGQILGKSGGTGRVTGPHLHFAVRWQGTYLDPATLLTLHPP